MAIYARIQNGTVAELITTSMDPSQLFNPALVWAQVTTQGVTVGWSYSNGAFTAPQPVVPPALVTPSLSQLQAELTAITAQIAALTASSTSGGTTTTSATTGA